MNALGVALPLALLAGAGALCRMRARADDDPGMLDAARLLEALLAADLCRLLLTALVLAPARDRGGVPFEGWDRAAFHGTQVLFLAWPFGLAALAWRLFSPTHTLAWIAALPFSLLCGRAWECYPRLRGEALADFYRFSQGVALGLALLSLAAPIRSRVGRAHLCSLLLLAGLAAELAGPYLADPFGSWWTAQATWSVVLAAVALTAIGRRPWGISAAP